MFTIGANLTALVEGDLIRKSDHFSEQLYLHKVWKRCTLSDNECSRSLLRKNGYVYRIAFSYNTSTPIA
jgi:hypothetical protein